jgi:hypothetical protein
MRTGEAANALLTDAPKAQGRRGVTHPRQFRHPFVTRWAPTTERIVSEGSGSLRQRSPFRQRILPPPPVLAVGGVAESGFPATLQESLEPADNARMGEVDHRLLRRWEASQARHKADREIDYQTVTALAREHVRRARETLADAEKRSATHVFFLEDR